MYNVYIYQRPVPKIRSKVVVVGWRGSMNSFSSIAWDQNYFGCIPLVARSSERDKISFNIHWFMLFRPNSQHTKSCAYFWHCQPHSTNIFYHNIWYYTVHQQSFKCKRAYQMLSIISTEIIHTHTQNPVWKEIEWKSELIHYPTSTRE